MAHLMGAGSRGDFRLDFDRSIFGSCITKRVFNLNDIETAEWAARHLSENTVYSQQISEGKSANEGRDFSYSEQSQKIVSVICCKFAA